MIKYKDLKKGDKILTKQLGTPVSGKLLESVKQGRGLKKIVLIFSNAKEIGLFSESGSVYARDILKVKRDGQWMEVTGAPALIIIHKLRWLRGSGSVIKRPSSTWPPTSSAVKMYVPKAFKDVQQLV